MSMTYTDLANALQSALVIDPTSDTDWANFMLQRTIEAGELRCYTEIDFATADTLLTPVNTSIGGKTIVFPPSILLVRYLNYVGPNGYVQLDLRDDSFVDEYIGAGVSGPPRFCALLSVDAINGSTFSLAPLPDAVYSIGGHGIERPVPLSAANPTTYLSVTYPNLLFFACMVYATGYQRNFGQQADDPKMAMSWEQQYQTAKAAAILEENRKRSQTFGDAITAAPSQAMP